MLDDIDACVSEHWGWSWSVRGSGRQAHCAGIATIARGKRKAEDEHWATAVANEFGGDAAHRESTQAGSSV